MDGLGNFRETIQDTTRTMKTRNQGEGVVCVSPEKDIGFENLFSAFLTILSTESHHLHWFKATKI